MLVASILLGALMGFTYDILRCVRRVVIHNIIFISIEDFIYWFVWTIVILSAISTYNWGELRLYIFLALLVGFIIYRYTIGWVVMRVFNYIWCPIKKCLEIIKKTLKKVIKKSKI